MMESPEQEQAKQLEDARETILGVLQGDITRENHPHVFLDDLLYFAVAAIARADAGWLLEHLSNRDYPFEHRVLVFSELTQHPREEVLAVLRAERPEDTLLNRLPEACTRVDEVGPRNLEHELAELNEGEGADREWDIDRTEPGRLVIIGGFDLCYYHDVEVELSGVAFVNCPSPSYFMEAAFRIASGAERESLRKTVSIGDDQIVVVIETEADGGVGVDTFFIVAGTVKITRSTVYHYRRENLKPGERIADWVDNDAS